MTADERLAAAGIELVPADIEKYRIVTRDGFIALVEHTASGFGRVGSAGLLTTAGMAPLMWRNGKPHFVAKGFDEPATDAQVAALRSFQSDLEDALRPRC